MTDMEGSEPDSHSDEGGSERARAANEFQIVEKLQAAMTETWPDRVPAAKLLSCLDPFGSYPPSMTYGARN